MRFWQLSVKVGAFKAFLNSIKNVKQKKYFCKLNYNFLIQIAFSSTLDF